MKQVKTKEFSYNPLAVYNFGPFYKEKKYNFNELTITVNKDSFLTKVLDPFSKYLNPPLNLKVLINQWANNPLQFYQNQLNLVVLLATVGCGVSFNHLNHPDPLTRSVYRFHFYYTVRRLLNELQIPIATDTSFNTFNNPFDKTVWDQLKKRI